MGLKIVPLIMDEKLSINGKCTAPRFRGPRLLSWVLLKCFCCIFNQLDTWLKTYNEKYTFPMIRTVISIDYGSNPSIRVLGNRYSITSDVISHDLNSYFIILEVWIR